MEFASGVIAHLNLATYCCDECRRVVVYPVERDKLSQLSPLAA
jgi:hypothetical protein